MTATIATDDTTMMSYDDALAAAGVRSQLCLAMKELLVERLDLSVEPEWITDDQPLFGRGLELDSVDALEVAVGMESAFEVTITDDDVGSLGSVNSVIDFVMEHGYVEEFLAARSGDNLL